MTKIDEIMAQVDLVTRHSNVCVGEEMINKYNQEREKLLALIKDAVRDAERYNWLINYFVSPDNSHDDCIVACNSPEEISAFIDKTMLSEVPDYEVMK